jgi:5-methylcytosine-specific restriction endonuclease McrA
MKTCHKCSKTKPYRDFNKCRRRGLQAKCRECEKAYYRANKERHKARCRAWAQANAPKRNSYKRKWYANNRDEINQKNRELYAEDPKKYLSRNREWAVNNPLKAKVPKVRYRVRKHNAAGHHSAAQLRDRFNYFGNKCVACGAEGPLHVDHNIPLKRGGTNWASNLVPLCVSCNCSKGASTLTEFLVR